MKPQKSIVWFSLAPERPLFASAGIWTRWRDIRGTRANFVEGDHAPNGFLTCPASALVGPVHPTAMPVLLTTSEEWDVMAARAVDGGKGAATAFAGRDDARRTRGLRSY